MFDNLREDYRRYLKEQRGRDALRAHLYAFMQYGFLATCVYRFGSWATMLRPRVIALPFMLIYVVLRVITHCLFGIDIPSNARIGPGLYIGHFGCVFLYGDAGRDLTVGQGVTLGYKGAGKSDGWPTLGDHVYIGTGAKVVGRVRVGNHVVIGANAVVVQDVGDRMRVVGAAMRITPLEVAPRIPRHETAAAAEVEALLKSAAPISLGNESRDTT